MKLKLFTTGALAAVLAASVATAQTKGCDSDQVPRVEAIVKAEGTKFQVQLKGNVGGLWNYLVKVKGPRDFDGMEFNEKESPVVDLAKFGKVVDGRYRFDISAASQELHECLDPEELELDFGRREKPPEKRPIGVSASGPLIVKDGVLVIFKQDEERGSEKPDPDAKDPDDRDGGKDNPDSGDDRRPGKEIDDGDREK